MSTSESHCEESPLALDEDEKVEGVPIEEQSDDVESPYIPEDSSYGAWKYVDTPMTKSQGITDPLNDVTEACDAQDETKETMCDDATPIDENKALLVEDEVPIIADLKQDESISTDISNLELRVIDEFDNQILNEESSAINMGPLTGLTTVETLEYAFEITEPSPVKCTEELSSAVNAESNELKKSAESNELEKSVEIVDSVSVHATENIIEYILTQPQNEKSSSDTSDRSIFVAIPLEIMFDMLNTLKFYLFPLVVRLWGMWIWAVTLPFSICYWGFRTVLRIVLLVSIWGYNQVSPNKKITKAVNGHGVKH